MVARQAGGPITQRGDFRFTSYFGQRIEELQEAQHRAAIRTAEWAVAEAQNLAPVDTGALRASIRSEVRRTQTTFAIVVYAGAEYALYVELGTSRMSAQPFLRPVLDRIGQQYRDFLAAEVRRIGRAA